MNVKELKQIIKNSTAVLVLDDGEPSFVIVGYDTYKNLTQDDKDQQATEPQEMRPIKANINSRETELLEKLNKEILAIKSQIEEDEARAAREDI